PAHRIPSDAIPPVWQGLLWGILPIGVSFLAIFFEFFLPQTRRISVGGIPVHSPGPERQQQGQGQGQRVAS
ncbi:MAG: hypothetical protein WBP97_12965, partial [Candidatus Sulfotelmatobacter sp.]